MAHADDQIKIAASIRPGIRRENDRDDLGGKQDLGAVSRQLLSQSALFRGLPADACKRLIGRARMRSFMPHQSIFLMGSEPDCMMAILTGRVQISLPSSDGNEMVLAVIGPGSILGEISLLHGGERTADARAMIESTVAILYRRDVLTFFDEHPVAWSNVVSVLCERLRHTNEQIGEVGMVALPVRLAKALLRMATPGQDLAAGYASSHINLTQRQLGKIIGATRESINKHLGVWQRKGVVQLRNGLIVIADRSSLEVLAGAASIQKH
jgi:CRP-like cAMP-binding protein